MINLHDIRYLRIGTPDLEDAVRFATDILGLFEEINESGTTIILTTHYLEEAENMCRSVAIIDRGIIIERDSMANVLRKLQTEVFVLNLSEPVSTPPALPGFRNEMTDDHTLEVEVTRGQSLNEIFTHLTSQGVRVNSMRNKVNRLEELFMRLVDISVRAADKGA